MSSDGISRRGAFQAAVAGLAARGPARESAGTPKLCLELAYAMLGTDPQSEAAARRIRQLGLAHVLSGGPRIPWDEVELRGRVERLKTSGLTLWNLMIGGFPNTLYGRKGRDEEISHVISSIRAAGRVGIPVVEYNFYANRLVEGYYEQLGRGGAGMTAYDYEKSRNLPPLEGIGTHTAEECWANLTYFLKAVIPEAERAGVKMALHPHDPPVPLSRGSAQIMSTLAGWKRLIAIVDSPSNGITFDCGVTCELGEDPVDVCRYFGSRQRINHVHYRNVVVRKPAVDYTEVFPDEGEVDLFGVMKELVKHGYSGVIYPEHPRALDADRERPNFKPFYPGGGSYVGATYNVAYARAMLQAALSEAAK
jgi:mannonate dehydratase